MDYLYGHGAVHVRFVSENGAWPRQPESSNLSPYKNLGLLAWLKNSTHFEYKHMWRAYGRDAFIALVDNDKSSAGGTDSSATGNLDS